MFERGELEAAERLSAPDLLWILDEPAWRPHLHRRAMPNAFGSRMNVRKKPFDDRRVRVALNYALDKHHVQKLLAGTAIPAHGVLAPGLAGRDDAIAPYPHDPAKARALLAEAGYPDGFDVDYLTTNDDDAQKLAASLQGDLGDVGVRVHVAITTQEAWATAIGKPDGPAFSLATWTADFPDPSNFIDALFASRMIADADSTNSAFYASPELDALLDRARGETDDVARAALYRRAERIVFDDAPWLFGYHQ